MPKITIPERKYDEIMAKAELIYNESVGVQDPYAFHKAFEFAKKELEKEGES